ncbi:penicillin-binding protein 1A [Sansalvadorimonas sp. 2012CJ34-2]|uniref:Penicillin-binding protein 1A n=1 Tax=Parendozoicomonas callyspongiae TaxID=2942213 RepID=A0ABT0PIL0_9GAMM|nr:penicillin-binding protein 1A [Sansalvadorimonas sp. 2012CJ34-2]MCL6270592.1 penicillin-binding protein 1A [Sansalvadorimonas sp. 2012CJ34-2]
MSKAVRVARFGLWCGVAVLCGALLIGSSAFLYLSPSLPSVESLRDVRLQTPLRIYAEDGSLIAEFGEKRRSPVNIEEVPDTLIKAFLAAEDDRFFSHNGVDINGLLRATVQLVSTGRIQSGGSTITMQVAKNFFLSRERVFSRKFNEILLAMEIERKLSKPEIIELYLNKIYLGNRAYGIEAAAQVYYGKSVDELSLAQMAMIAGLPKAPSKYNPLANAPRSLLRRNWILERMRDLGYITEAEFTEAVDRPVTARYHSLPIDLEAPYVAEAVRMEVAQLYGANTYTDGYEVYTSINSEQQRAANTAIDKGLQAYDERHGYRGPEQELSTNPAEWQQTLNTTSKIGQLQAAVVTDVSEQGASILFRDGSNAVLDWEGMKWAKPYIDVNRQGKSPKIPEDVLKPGYLIRVRASDEGWRLSQIPEAQSAMIAIKPEDGAITAMVGGFNFYDSKYNRVTQANRQVGSAFKPFVYSAAIQKGANPATMINDAPVVFNDDKLESHWRPQNDNQKFYGPTRIREGLYRSRNLVSIRLLQRTGVNYTLDYMEQLGLPRDKLPENLSLSLGSAGLTPLELATGYTVIANGGFKVEPYMIRRIDRLDTTVLEYEPTVACRECTEEDFQKQEELAQEQVQPVVELDATDIDTTDQLKLLADIAQPEIPVVRKLAPRVMDKRTNYIMYDMMQDVIQRGTGRRAKALNRSDLAGKTGTTNDQRDVWFSGFNPSLQATVWLGFDQPSTLGRWEYGANAALPIWIDFIKVALRNQPDITVPQPEGLVTLKIDPKTGQPAAPGDPDAIFEIFRAEDAPKISPIDNPGSSNETEEETFNPGDIF